MNSIFFKIRSFVRRCFSLKNCLKTVVDNYCHGYLSCFWMEKVILLHLLKYVILYIVNKFRGHGDAAGVTALCEGMREDDYRDAKT